MFNGSGSNLSNIARLSNAKSRSISAENFTGEKGMGGMATDGTGAGAARELGQGWKVSPSINILPNEERILGFINMPGIIKHIWMTMTHEVWRYTILKIYWDDEEEPSVYSPVADFFLNGWAQSVNVNSLPIVVNPNGGFNSYFEMPFRKSAKITIQNLSDKEYALYYQIDYLETDVPLDVAYFHANWNRIRYEDADKDYTIIEGIKGKGQYVGTYLAWQPTNNHWWGEGEIKFFMDGDINYPTICGTGTEDYFGGAWDWELPKGSYCTYSTPYLGMHQVIKPDGLYSANTRFGMYRFHILDPIYFENDMRVTIQDLGWKSGGRYLQQRSDIASVAYWYQTEPHNKLKYVTDVELLEL